MLEWYDQYGIEQFQYYLKDDGIELSGEVLGKYNELKNRNDLFKLRECIIKKLKYEMKKEMNTDFYFYDVSELVMNYEDPFNNIDAIIDEALKAFKPYDNSSQF